MRINIIEELENMNQNINNSPLVFIHVPKTAGSSLIRHLDDLYDLEDIVCEVTTEALLQKKFLKYRPGALFRGHFFASYFTESGFSHKNTKFITFLSRPLNFPLTPPATEL